MFALLVAAAMATQDAPPEPKPLSVEETHDQVRGESTSALTIGRVYTAPEAWMPRIDMALSYTWRGVDRPALKPADQVKVVVKCSAKDWTFRDKNDLAMLAEGERLRNDAGERWADVGTEYVYYRRPRQVGAGPIVMDEGYDTLARCKEVITWTLPFGDLQRFMASQANSIDTAVGDQAWKLDKPQVDAIRRWMARLAVTSEEAKRAEEAFEKAQADAKATQDARLAPYKGDVLAVIEKARKAMRGVPKKQYATVGEKLKWRTFDREIEAVVRKHKLKPADLEALLSEYPDFKARNKIQ